MGKFTQLCKRVFLLKKKSASKDDQAGKPKPSRRLWKKSKQNKESVSNPASASPDQGQDVVTVEEELSPTQVAALQQAQKDTIGAGSIPQRGAPSPPLTPHDPSKGSSPREESTEEGTTIRDSLRGGAASSSHTSVTTPEHESSAVVVYELPADVPTSSACGIQLEQGARGNGSASSTDAVRYEEAKYWGGIASEVRRHQLVEERELRGWNTSDTTAAEEACVVDPEVRLDSTFGVCERTVEGSGDGNLLRILSQGHTSRKQDSAVHSVSTQGEDEEYLAKNAEAKKILPLVNGSSARSETSTTHLPCPQEQPQDSDVEDLEDEEVSNFEATIASLETKIEEIEAKAKNEKSHKETAQKIGKKKVDALTKELARQKEQLEDALSENLSKEAELDAARSKIASMDVELRERQDRIARLVELEEDMVDEYQKLYTIHTDVEAQQATPLQQEVARLTSLNFEQHKQISFQTAQIATFQQQLPCLPSTHQLQSDLLSATAQVDRYKAIAAHTCSELQQAQCTLKKQQNQIRNYCAEHENFPAHGAHTDGLLQKQNERYRSLEKEANKAFLQMKEMEAHHEHEKIMLKATNEDSQKRVDDLERKVILAEDEAKRSSGVVYEYVEAGTAPEEVLRRSLAASEKTVEDLKSRFRFQGIQLGNVEKALVEQRAEVQHRDLWLAEKDSALHAAREENQDAQNALDDKELQSASDKQALRETIDAKHKGLADALKEVQSCNDTIVELTEDLHALAHSPSVSDAAKVVELRHIQIEELREQVRGLEGQIPQPGSEHHTAVGTQHEQFNLVTEAEVSLYYEAALRRCRRERDDALSQVQKLQEHIALIEQGCDPEKFEIFKRCEKLEKERDALMAEKQATDSRLGALGEEMATTFEDAGKAIEDRNMRVRVLVNLVRQMAECLKEAWFAGKDGLVAGADPKEQVLEYVRGVVRDMLAGIPAAQEEENANDEEQDHDGGYKVEGPVQEDNSADLANAAETADGLASTNLPSYASSTSSAPPPPPQLYAKDLGPPPDASGEDIDAYLDALMLRSTRDNTISTTSEEEEAAQLSYPEDAYGPADYEVDENLQIALIISHPLPNNDTGVNEVEEDVKGEEEDEEEEEEVTEAEIISPEVQYMRLHRLARELGMVAVYPECVEWAHVWCYADEWEGAQQHGFDHDEQGDAAMGDEFDYDEAQRRGFDYDQQTDVEMGDGVDYDEEVEGVDGDAGEYGVRDGYSRDAFDYDEEEVDVGSGDWEAGTFVGYGGHDGLPFVYEDNVF
ncbi:MAG: hypothetical protein Q9210_002804 [Variospora velana]